MLLFVDEDVEWINQYCWRKSATNLVQKIKEGFEKIHGGIVLDPIYQRKYKFTIKKESSIIESLILGIPIPIIYLSKDTEQETVLLNVIDGMHRLNSIYRFFNNEYALRGLKILKQLEGKKFAQLPAKVRNALQFDSQVRIDSIDVSGNAELEYEVFLRFNQETNPLTKQELNEVMYRSEYSYWFKGLVQELVTDSRYIRLFNITDKKIKDKSTNYNLHVALAYREQGLIPGKNDTTFLVSSYMKKMQRLIGDKLEEKKQDTITFLEGFINFCDEISNREELDFPFSRQFIDGEVPKGNHTFLISYLIPLVLIYKYMTDLGYYSEDGNKDFHAIYEAIRLGMNNANFYDFGGVSSTSFVFQNNCFQSIKREIEDLFA